MKYKLLLFASVLYGAFMTYPAVKYSVEAANLWHENRHLKSVVVQQQSYIQRMKLPQRMWPVPITVKTPEESTVLAVVNRNPLNVKRLPFGTWQGQVGVDQHGHIIFDTPANGVRAAASVLLNYYHKHKLDTLQGIVNRFCTATPERKARYARFISKRIGVPADQQFAVLEKLPEILAAMARFESGYEWDRSLFVPYNLIHHAYNKGKGE